MRGMLTVLGRKLGLIHPSGTFEIFPAEAEEWSTLGAPSLVFTANGVEGPFWPEDSMGDTAASDQPQESEDPVER